MRRLVKFLTVAAILAAAVFWVLTRPDYLPDDPIFATDGNAEHGRQVFLVAGCAACHMAAGAQGDDRLRLGGGQRFASPFGTFIAPNISSDVETGIGGWSNYDLANALIRGISPRGQHLYPVLPYTSYAQMRIADAVDLRAYLRTLPPVVQANAAHELPLPFRLRRGLGLWKLLFLNPSAIAEDAPERGRYLVEALGHCAECHTPRNILGGTDRSRWMAGAPNPSGLGRIPNITPHADGLASWAETDIAYFLTTGFTPEFDTAGGEMVEVISNLSQLPAEDLTAIAAYLASLPPLPDLP